MNEGLARYGLQPEPLRRVRRGTRRRSRHMAHPGSSESSVERDQGRHSK